MHVRITYGYRIRTLQSAVAISRCSSQIFRRSISIQNVEIATPATRGGRGLVIPEHGSDGCRVVGDRNLSNKEDRIGKRHSDSIAGGKQALRQQIKNTS